ncbi:MAG: hypothetical protein HZB95_00545 [Nitrosomonadales bacterium]|nr:hypothetical protein [Nitrosomonadales bacterium]
MNHPFARIPAHFYRVSLHSENDNMTMALVPDQNHAQLIAKLLTEHYGLRKDERIVVSTTVIRPSAGAESTHIELTLV